jgi:Spy/CpxP family protein refolding chaperone
MHSQAGSKRRKIDMKTRNCRSWNWALVAGTSCIVLMIASWSFGEEPPLQQNRPVPGGRFMRPNAEETMSQGMPGPGARRSQGPGTMPGGQDMGQRNPIAALLKPEVQKELAITTEQRQKLEDIRFSNEKETIQHRASLQVLHLELSRLVDLENPDRAVIDKKIQEVAQEEAFLLRSLINSRLNARATLTAEQRSKLEQIMQNRRMEGRMPAEISTPGDQPFPRANQARRQGPQPAAPAKP